MLEMIHIVWVEATLCWIGCTMCCTVYTLCYYVVAVAAQSDSDAEVEEI